MRTQCYSVNQHLIEAVMAWVKSGKIAIREIQRPFAWGATKARDLMDSLYQGYSVSYIIVWRIPTILVVSNGEFSYPDSLIDLIERRRDTHAMQVHGVLIGSSSPAMARLCDPLHHFSKWNDLSPDWE